MSNATTAAMYASSDAERAHTFDPHHCGCRVADDATRPARVGRRYDGGKVTDMDFAPEHAPGHCSSDQSRGDVIEEG